MRMQQSLHSSDYALRNIFLVTKLNMPIMVLIWFSLDLVFFFFFLLLGFFVQCPINFRWLFIVKAIFAEREFKPCLMVFDRK